jgi:NADPH:quinone reductase-like Zn-dependent oxidoreductase
MRAIAFQQTGPADVLQEMDLPRAVPGPGQLLIRVIAAGVNPSDPLFRSGGLPFVRLQFPFIPGLDVAGIVESVGKDVQHFKPGDPVYGMLPTARMGGYAEYATLDAGAAAIIPANLTFIEAAAIPCAALTAFQSLLKTAHLQPGMRVLVHGASGGVGSFAVQIARAAGAAVTATTSARNLDWVSGLGAEAVVDYATLPGTAFPSPFDVVLDAVGVLTSKMALPWLRAGGTGVTVNPLRGNPLAGLRARLASRQWKFIFVRPSGDDLMTLNRWLAEGLVRPQLERIYPLAEAAAAHQASETKRVRGKLVLMVDPALAHSKPMA